MEERQCVCVFAYLYGVIVCDPGIFFFFRGEPVWPSHSSFDLRDMQLQGLVCVSVLMCVCAPQERSKGAMGVRGGFDSAGHRDPSPPLFRP